MSCKRTLTVKKVVQRGEKEKQLLYFNGGFSNLKLFLFLSQYISVHSWLLLSHIIWLEIKGAMAKWLKDYLSFGSRKVPPQPPTPDYTESEILKAYRLQRDLDFEDPYDNSENRSRGESGASDPATPVYGSPMKSSGVDVKSPKHRLIKVDSQELGRTKILLSAISLEDHAEPVRVSLSSHVPVGIPNKEQVMTNVLYSSHV